jgi:transposase
LQVVTCGGLLLVVLGEVAVEGGAADAEGRPTDYAALLDAAHQQLGGSIVLIWDNLNTHVSAVMRALISARDWLHVIRLPAYVPDLNPVERVWSHLKRGLGNLAVQGIDDLAAIVKNRLKRIQYRPELTDAFFAQTGLTLEPTPP